MRTPALVALLLAATVLGAAAPAAASAGAPADDRCVDSVAFYTLSPSHPPPVRIGYSADAGDRVFFVLSADGDVVGHTDRQTFTRGVAVDGQEIPLDAAPSGFTSLTVTAYADTDGDGAFDPATDEPCTYEGERVDSTMRAFFPNRTDAVGDAAVALGTPDVGAVTSHEYGVTVREATTLRAVAVDHAGTDVPPRPLTTDDVTVAVNGEALALANVTRPEGVTTAALADPVSLSPGDRVTLRLDPAKNPGQDRTLAVALNPYGEAWAADTVVDVERGPPVSDLALFPVSAPSPPPVKIGFAAEREAPVAFAVLVDGERVGQTAFRSFSPGSSVDGLRVSVTADLTGEHDVTVVALHDSNGNGAVDDADEPYRVDGEAVAVSRTLEFGDGATTADGSTDTSTDDPDGESSGGVNGFGLGIAVLSLAAAALLARRE